ncbi:MAG: hypothetical protein COB36_07800 [Alphaproteobacteria bacterium]|nr:MAG: hypothetical protein COB36_07800 [Alphaproteobacteria bacterium]
MNDSVDKTEVSESKVEENVCAVDGCVPCAETKNCGSCATGRTCFILGGLFGVYGAAAFVTGGSIPAGCLIATPLFFVLGLYLLHDSKKRK